MTREEYECEFQALITEREGMLATNQQRMQLGQSMGYVSEHFDILANRFRQLAKKEVTP